MTSARKIAKAALAKLSLLRGLALADLNLDSIAQSMKIKPKRK
jgi:hypothetical protein